MAPGRDAAIVTVGSELVTGERLDTNTRDIALALRGVGYRVRITLSLPDDVDLLAAELARLTTTYPLVVVTGGLGPTHDDVTREAASHALGLPLERDAALEASLRLVASRHAHPDAAARIAVQADVLRGATVLPAVLGTAPGQIAPTPAGRIVLLPGPPRELAPLLQRFLADEPGGAPPVRLRLTGITESDAQIRVTSALGDPQGIDFTVLAAPGDVEVLLFDAGAGHEALVTAGVLARMALADVCYSTDGSSLAEVVVRAALDRGVRLATAESCTGGMVAAALTSVPGASAVVAGGIVAYANDVKATALGVPVATLEASGAVSADTAAAMAAGAATRLSATHAVSITGIAGPEGGTPDKPVGLVWFALWCNGVLTTEERRFSGDRFAVRARATAQALDLLRRALTAE